MHTILTIPLHNFYVCSFQNVCKFQHLKWHLQYSSECLCTKPLVYHAYNNCFNFFQTISVFFHLIYYFLKNYSVSLHQFGPTYCDKMPKCQNFVIKQVLQRHPMSCTSLLKYVHMAMNNVEAT